MGQALGRERRLRQRSDFDRVFREGRRLGGRMFTLIAAPGRGDSDRLGLAVSRRVGGAVQRNRARRLLRDAFRRLSKTGAPTYDVVLVARPEISGRTQAEVDGELSKRFQRLVAQRGRASPPAAD